MYVCVCNGLTSRQVESVAGECASAGHVYRSLGVKPRCGKCIPTIRDTMAAVRRQRAEELAPEPLTV